MYYQQYCLELSTFYLVLETVAISSGERLPGLSRQHIFKIISLALNAAITDDAENAMPQRDNQRKQTENKLVRNSTTQIGGNSFEKFQDYIGLLKIRNDLENAPLRMCACSPYTTTGSEHKREKRKKRLSLIPDEFMNAMAKDVRSNRWDYISENTQEAKGKKPGLLDKLEVLLVEEQEKLNLLLDLSKMKWHTYCSLKMQLRDFGCAVNENSHAIYKALVEVALLRYKARNWKLSRARGKVWPITPGLRTLMSYLPKRMHEDVIEAVVLLALGITKKATIKTLAKGYVLEPELDAALVKCFFVGTKPPHILYSSCLPWQGQRE